MNLIKDIKKYFKNAYLEGFKYQSLLHIRNRLYGKGYNSEIASENAAFYVARGRHANWRALELFETMRKEDSTIYTLIFTEGRKEAQIREDKRRLRLDEKITA